MVAGSHEQDIVCDLPVIDYALKNRSLMHYDQHCNGGINFHFLFCSNVRLYKEAGLFITFPMPVNRNHHFSFTADSCLQINKFYRVSKEDRKKKSSYAYFADSYVLEHWLIFKEFCLVKAIKSKSLKPKENGQNPQKQYCFLKN